MPRFLVTMPPGFFAPGIGVVTPGSSFEADDSLVPSRTFWPMDKAAAAKMQKLKDGLLAEAERTQKEAAAEEDKDDKKNLTRRAKALREQASNIRTEVYAAPAEEKVVTEELSMRQLDEIQAAGRQHPAAAEQQKQGRAADK